MYFIFESSKSNDFYIVAS